MSSNLTGAGGGAGDPPGAGGGASSPPAKAADAKDVVVKSTRWPKTSKPASKDASKETREGKWRRRGRRAAIAAGIALVLFTVIGFFVVPPVARHVAKKQLSELLGRRVEIAKIRFNPFALSLGVEGFQIFEADKTTPFVGFRRLFVNLQIASVYRLGPVVKEVSLDGLRIHVMRKRATPESFGDLDAYNFSDILARFEAMPKGPPAPPPDPNAPPPRFSINNIRITDGAVIYDDQPLGVHHELSAFTLGVPFASTLPVYIDSFVQPGISLKIDGTPFEAHGRTKPFKDSLETVLELRLDDLDLTRYVPFVPMALPFAVESARLRVALDVSFVRPSADAPSLSVRGTLGVHDIDLREKRSGGLSPLLHLGKFEVALGDANLTTQTFRVDSVRLAGLDVHVRRQRDGELNLLRMIPAAPAEGKRGRKKSAAGASASAAEERTPAAKKPTASSPTAPATADASAAGPAFSVASIKLDGIKVHFEDQTTSPAFTTLVDDVLVTIAGLSNAAKAKPATVQLGLRATPGGTVAHNGTLSLAPALRAAGTLTVEGIEPGRLAPYYHDMLAFDVASGRVRLGAGYQFVAGARAAEPPSVKLEHAFVELADFALRRTGHRDDFVRLGELAVRETDVDLSRRTVRVGQIATRDARIRAERDEKGVVDLTTLVVEPKGADARAKAPADQPPPAAEPSAPTEAPWLVEVAKFDLTKWGLRFSDRAVKPRAELAIEPLEAHLTKLSTAPGAQLGFNVRMGINRTGTLALSGTAAYQPSVKAKLRFDLKGLQVVPFQPYFADQVNLTVTDGAIALGGQASVEIPPAPPARRGVTAPAPEPRIQATADLGITDFAAVDRGAGEKLVGWKAFRVVGADVKTAPLVARVKEIGLDGLDAKLTMFADGRMNLAEAFAPPGAAADHKAAEAKAESKGKPKAKPSPASATPSASPQAAPAGGPVVANADTAVGGAPAPVVSVGTLALGAGALTFEDRSVDPHFTADITGLDGKITGLSTSADTQADVALRASINRVGELSVTGKANPLAKDLFADVKVEIKDVELPPASPYSGKFVGFNIDKGKLGVALDYHIAKKKLEATNRLILDQFTFGKKVESKDAVDVPVRLGVAILKDRHGVIDLELPISGSLDDPEFKIGRLILKVLGNLIVKAVTAPFSYIAAAFGGGDELSKLTFAPGQATVDAGTSKKVSGLGRALRERPGLSFEIIGFADPNSDRERLRRQTFERKLAAQRMQELVDDGAEVPSLDNVQVAAADRPRLLEKAYKAETFDRPRNALGMLKSLPGPEMEKLILAHIQVSDGDLRALALRRATAVQGALAKAAPDGAKRLFLLDPRVDGGGGRVELSLKKD